MGDYWKHTHELFTKISDKPKMTEKLLTKPPFKYIFDIITQITKKTSFPKGLYQGPELSADFYSDKEKKINYLNKIIGLIQMITKQELRAKSNKIVSGLQPQNTNQMLQTICKVATSGNDYSTLIKKFLKGQKQEQPAKKPEEKKKDVSKDKEKEREREKEREKEKEKEKEKEVAKPMVRPPSATKGSKKSAQVHFQLQPQPPKKQDKQDQIVYQPAKRPIKEGPMGKIQKQALQIQENEEKEKESQDHGGGIKIAKKKKKKDIDKKDGNIVPKTGQLTNQDLQNVRSLVQTICQNATPLGKSVQFIHDDLESMNHQFQLWRKQYSQAKDKMQTQLRVTEDHLMPLYDKITQIDQKIKDQKSKIQGYKAQILKNQTTIKQLLLSVVTTK